MNSKKAQPEDDVAIPGLDVAKAKRYSHTKLAALLLSTLWTLARLAWFASDRRAARLQASIASGIPDRRLGAGIFHGDYGAFLALQFAGRLLR